MSPRESLSSRLRSLRQNANLTLESLAERAGVSVRTLSDIERGVSRSPQRRTLQMIAVGLGLEGSARDEFLWAGRFVSKNRMPSLDGVTPHSLTDFTGREGELAELNLHLLNASTASGVPPLAIICGPPGMGKTSSALEVVKRMQDAWPLVLFVDLEGFGTNPLTPLGVMRALLRQLPGVEGTVPATLEAARILWRSAVADRRPAILLDNAANETQVRTVLNSAAHGPVIVTSRRTLAGLEGAHRVILTPLSPDDSRTLLTRLISPTQYTAGDLQDLARLCDQVPLALRIAGNRIASRPAWSARDFITRLQSTEDRLRLLVAGDLAVESAIALSYDDLEPATAATFRSLAVIDVGTFDARLAASTTGADVLDTESQLDELTDLGLLEARGGNRYRMHDLLRLFATVRLRREDGQAAVEHRRVALRSWLLGTLERAGAWFEPGRPVDSASTVGAAFPDADTAGAWIRAEADHWWPALVSAAHAGQHAVVVDTADALHWFSDVWLQWGRWHDFFALSTASAAVLGNDDHYATHAGYLAWTEIVERGDPEAAMKTAHRARAAAVTAGNATQQGWASFYLAWAAKDLGLFDEAAAAASEAMTAFRAAGDLDGETQAMSARLSGMRSLTHHERAVTESRAFLNRLEEALPAEPEPATIIGLLTIQEHVSANLLALRRYDDVLESTGTALLRAREIDATMRIVVALGVRAKAHIGLGNDTTALRDIDEALALLGNPTDAYMIKRRLELLDLNASLAAKSHS